MRKRIRSHVTAATSLAVLCYSLNILSSLRNPILESGPGQIVRCAGMRNLAMAILDDERSEDAAGWHQNRMCKSLRQVDIFRTFSASDDPLSVGEET